MYEAISVRANVTIHMGIAATTNQGAAFQYSNELEKKRPITIATIASHSGSKRMNSPNCFRGGAEPVTFGLTSNAAIRPIGGDRMESTKQPTPERPFL